MGEKQTNIQESAFDSISNALKRESSAIYEGVILDSRIRVIHICFGESRGNLPQRFSTKTLPPINVIAVWGRIKKCFSGIPIDVGVYGPKLFKGAGIFSFNSNIDPNHPLPNSFQSKNTIGDYKEIILESSIYLGGEMDIRMRQVLDIRLQGLLAKFSFWFQRESIPLKVFADEILILVKLMKTFNWIHSDNIQSLGLKVSGLELFSYYSVPGIRNDNTQINRKQLLDLYILLDDLITKGLIYANTKKSGN